MNHDTEQIEMLKKLRHTTQNLMDQCDPADFPGEAVNWGDLDVTEARLVLTDTGDSYLEVTIEEASPDGCPEFLEYIADLLSERGAASPDGLVDFDGLVEIKCPNTATHLDYLLAGTVPAKYQPQMLWQMACAERTWCDFVSFDPRLPEEHQLFVVRFARDQARIDAIEAEVRAFLAEVDETINRLRNRAA